MLGCTIPDRAPHLVPSIQEFLRRLGRPADLGEVGCCGSLEVEVGRAMPSVRVKAGVVADPICFEQYGAELLGVLAMQHLFDLKPPFYYYAPHRIVNGDHARVYPLYDALRRCFGCDMNIDLNRLARSTSAGSIQGLSGNDARDISAAVARLSEIVLPLRPNGALERAFPHQSSSGHDPTGGSNDATDAEADLWRSAGDSHGAAGSP